MIFVNLIIFESLFWQIVIFWISGEGCGLSLKKLGLEVHHDPNTVNLGTLDMGLKVAGLEVQVFGQPAAQPEKKSVLINVMLLKIEEGFVRAL